MKQSTPLMVVGIVTERVPTRPIESLEISTLMRHPAIPPAARNP
jgi:hypothetical protein